jgi:hypothetical protein
VLSRFGYSVDYLRVMGTSAGLLGAFIMWLTFIPPGWYRRLIRARAERTEARES